jgi:ribosomal protein L22
MTDEQKNTDTQRTSSAGTGEQLDEAETPKPAKKPRAKKAAPKAKAAAAEATTDEAEAAEATEEAVEEEPAAKPRAKTAAAKPAKPARTAPARRRDRQREAPGGVEVRAQAKYVRTSARKARLVCDHIRGKDVAQARAILAFTPRAAAKDWAKLLESAVANAEHNHELVGEDLKITAVYADEGPTLKRYRPRAMGRATRIRKRTSHLTITLTPKEL